MLGASAFWTTLFGYWHVTRMRGMNLGLNRASVPHMVAGVSMAYLFGMIMHSSNLNSTGQTAYYRYLQSNKRGIVNGSMPMDMPLSG
jgi:hypothetical protein